MDEIEMLRDRHDAQAAPSAEAVTEARARLMAHTRAAGGGSRRRGFRLPWPAMAGLGLTAAAATVAVAVVVTSGTTPRGTTATPTREVRLSASQVLLAAATKADLQPQATGRYWHTSTRSTWVLRVGTKADPFLVSGGSREDTWLAREPVHGTSWSWRQDLGIGPLTPADTAVWKRAGSPAMVKMINRGVAGKQVPIGPSGKVIGGRTDPTNPGDAIYAIGPKNVTMKDLLALPADPGRLKSYLLSMYKGHDTESSGRPMSADAWLFTVSSGLVMGMPAKPAVRAAAYRMLSKLPGVTVIGTVKDPAGRPGTAIAINERTSHNGLVQHRLIIDRESGRALASAEVALEPAGTTEGFPRGTVFAHSVYQANGWTDDKPHPPAP